MSRQAADHYDRVTAGWRLIFGDHLHFGLFKEGVAASLDDATDHLVDRMIAMASVASNDQVVDVGCGTGAPAIRLARNVGCGVTAITNSAEGAKASRLNVAAAGFQDRIRVVEADALNSGLGDSSVSVAWILESSHLFADKAALLAEAHRMLRPGGRLVLCDIIEGEGQSGRRPSKEDVVALRAMQRVFGPIRVVPLSRYEDLLVGAGFRSVKREDVTMACLPTMPAWRENVLCHRVALGKLWTESEIVEFEACSVQIEAAMRAGRIGYGLLTAER